jgi:hypothetical protein
VVDLETKKLTLPRQARDAQKQVVLCLFNVYRGIAAIVRRRGAYQGISTLQESPIHGLHLSNISFTMVPASKGGRAAWTCTASCDEHKKVSKRIC